MSLNKKAYFQGGGGVNEPTPGQKKYKSDPAIVVQPRFKEPFYRNYDLYTIPGMEDIGPGTGYHGLQNYDSVQEFLEARRKRLKPRYVADDSWQIDSGERVKKNPDRKARMAIFEKIIKQARMPGMSLVHKLLDKFKADDNDGPNYDLGKGLYQEMSDGKVDSVEEFRDDAPHGPGALMTDDNEDHMLPPKEHGTSIYNWRNSIYQGTPKSPNKKYRNKDKNNIDFPIDEQVNHQDQMIYPEVDEYQIRREKGDRYEFPSEGSPLDPGELNISMTTPQIAGEHSYIPNPDFEGKSDNGSQLDFGRDYTEETLPGRGSDIASDNDNQTDLDELEAKYLESTETGLFGLPDGVDPVGHDADQTEQIEDPFTGTSDIGTQIYDDKWNI